MSRSSRSLVTLGRSLAAGAVLLPLALAGCTGSSPSASSGSSTTPPASPSGTTSATSPTSSTSGTTPPSPTSSAPSSSSTAAAVTRCTAAQVVPSLEAGSPGAGQRGAVLRLRNSSSVTCTVFGFAGLQLVTASGTAVPTSVVRVSADARATVRLAPGASAAATVRWTAITSEGDQQTGACQPTAAKVQVTPPDERAHDLISWGLGPVCAKGTLRLTPFLAAG